MFFLQSFKNFRLITLLAIVMVFFGCSSTTPIPEGEFQTAKKDGGGLTETTYKIGVDDIVQVSVWNNPNLSITVPVRPDGKISMPLIGDVQAGGWTPEEVAAEIKRKLAVHIREPNVAVIMTALHSHEYLARVRVTGAVRTPSSLPHRQGMTVLDAILAAGGLNDFAAPSRAKLYRNVSGETKSLSIDLDDILNGGRLESNFVLKPGDVITVPERIF